MKQDAIEDVLILSVGGSDQPLRSSLSKMQPDRVVFVVSDGSGNSQSSKAQADKLFDADGCPLKKWQVLKVPPDDPDAALAIIEPVLVKLLAAGANLTVDYTGGTKSMTSAMVLAATCHEDVRLQFMAGVRRTLDQVEDGTEKPTEIPTDLIGLSQTFRIVHGFISLRNYGAIRTVLSETQKSFEHLKGRVPKNWRRKVSCWHEWVTILDHWDRFDHARAWQDLERALKDNKPHALWFHQSEYYSRLEKLANSNKRPSPELLEDLWLNSQRRAELGNYDDAVARLYRLMEAAVQTRLWVLHNLLTDSVPRKGLPDELLQRNLHENRDGTVKLGLSDSIALLRHIEPNNPLTATLSTEPPQWKGQRNHSVLAHGFNSLDEQDWKQAKEWFEKRRCSIWEQLLGRQTAKQLPESLPNLF